MSPIRSSRQFTRWRGHRLLSHSLPTRPRCSSVRLCSLLCNPATLFKLPRTPPYPSELRIQEFRERPEPLADMLNACIPPHMPPICRNCIVRTRTSRGLDILMTNGGHPYRGYATYQSVGRAQTSVWRWRVLDLAFALAQEGSHSALSPPQLVADGGGVRGVNFARTGGGRRP